MLAQNAIDLKSCELMIDWCASVLDAGEQGTTDRCVQVLGGTGVTGDSIVEQVFREVRAFRIYDGPTEVHKGSLAKKIKRKWQVSRVTGNSD